LFAEGPADMGVAGSHAGAVRASVVVIPPPAMRTTTVPKTGPARAALGAVLVFLVWSPAPLRAQLPDWQPPAWRPDDWPARVFDPGAAASTSLPAGRQRIRLFRFAPGFLSDPVGLQDDDSAAGVAPSPPTTDADGPDWVQVAMGSDNPYFDFRLPGDPGGLGYNRLVTQVQVLDTARTACTLGLQAVTPAGLQSNGIQDGPTVVTPALGVFHALDQDTAVQGFLGKNVPVNNTGAAPVRRNLQYGMAVQRSLLGGDQDSLGHLYFYMGALGRYRVDSDVSEAPNLKLLPGLHWKLSDAWWMSGGVMLPVTPTHAESSLPWQFTCSFQF
jgi:hypothetical protein